MLNFLISADYTIFAAINADYCYNLLDNVMPIVTNAKIWFPFILAAWFYLLLSRNRKLVLLAVMLLISTGLTDLFCARVVKNLVGRTRPCAMDTSELKVRLLVGKTTSRSFPSNHAATTAAFASMTAFLCGFWPALPLIMISFVIGYSRVYCGVHFPFDVLAGWIIGICISWLIVRILRKKWPDKLVQECEQTAVLNSDSRNA